MGLLMNRLLKNESDQRFIARIYLGLVIAIALRPIGPILATLEELTFFDNNNISLIFIFLFGYLRRAQPIHVLKYIAALVPLGLFCAYILTYLFTTPDIAVFSGVFMIMCWYTIFKNFSIALEVHE